MSSKELFITNVFDAGPLHITNTVVTTWVIMALFALAAIVIRLRLREPPGRAQVLIEAVVQTMHDAIAAVLPRHARPLLPFIGTLWLFVAVANLISVIPAVRSPTGDLSLTAALAVLVFLSVHVYGIRTQGLRDYLRHYLKPSPILLPFHVIGEISRTLALAVRLFGNMFSLQMAAAVILLVAGFLAPVPVLLLHVVEAIVQAYIFGTLALVYIAGAIQSQQASRQSGSDDGRPPQITGDSRE